MLQELGFLIIRLLTYWVNYIFRFLYSSPDNNVREFEAKMTEVGEKLHEVNRVMRINLMNSSFIMNFLKDLTGMTPFLVAVVMIRSSVIAG